MPFDLETDIAQRLGTSRDAISPVLRQVIDRVRQQMTHYGYARVSGLGAFRQREDTIEFEPDPVLAEGVNIQFTGLDEIFVLSSTDQDALESTIADHQADDGEDVTSRIEEVESTAWSEAVDDDDADPARESVDFEGEPRDFAGAASDFDTDASDFDSDASDFDSEAADVEGEFTDFERANGVEDEAPGFDEADTDTDAGPDLEVSADPGATTDLDASPDLDATTDLDASPDPDLTSEQFDDRDQPPPAVTWRPIEQASSHPSPDEHADVDPFETTVPEPSEETGPPVWSESDTPASDDLGPPADGPASEPGEELTSPDYDDSGESLAVPVTSASLAPDRQSRPHEWHRQQSRTKRAAADVADAADEGARGGQRSYIWIAFGLIVVAAAAIAFFLLVPFEPDGPAVSEQTQPPAAVEDTAEAPAETADATGETASPDTDDGTTSGPLSAGQWEPLQSTDEIEPARDGYTIVVWSEVSREQAQVEARRYRDEGFRTGVLDPQDDASNRLRVGVGQFDTVEEAAAVRDSLAGNAIPNDAWVLRIP